jgi:hypothetical protein
MTAEDTWIAPAHMPLEVIRTLRKAVVGDRLAVGLGPCAVARAPVVLAIHRPTAHATWAWPMWRFWMVVAAQQWVLFACTPIGTAP